MTTNMDNNISQKESLAVNSIQLGAETLMDQFAPIDFEGNDNKIGVNHLKSLIHLHGSNLSDELLNAVGSNIEQLNPISLQRSIASVYQELGLNSIQDVKNAMSK